jgi:hypothetical protein
MESESSPPIRVRDRLNAVGKTVAIGFIGPLHKFHDNVYGDTLVYRPPGAVGSTARLAALTIERIHALYLHAKIKTTQRRTVGYVRPKLMDRLDKYVASRIPPPNKNNLGKQIVDAWRTGKAPGTTDSGGLDT